MRTLLLNPPAFSDPSRFERESDIYWYPVDLCRTAAVLADCRVVDAPPHQVSALESIELAADFELVVLLTSESGVSIDLKLVEMMKIVNPSLKVAFVGPGVSVDVERSLENTAVDYVVHGEYCSAIAAIANGMTPQEHQPAWVTKVYQRDLDIRRYRVPFLLYPYMSLSARRAADEVVAEIEHARTVFPDVREYFFDDDVFRDPKPRVLELCSRLQTLKSTWSCKTTATADFETLMAMRDSGCRLVVLEPASGETAELPRQLAEYCRKLGIEIGGQRAPIKSRLSRLFSFVGGSLRNGAIVNTTHT